MKLFVLIIALAFAASPLDATAQSRGRKGTVKGTASKRVKTRQKAKRSARRSRAQTAKPSTRRRRGIDAPKTRRVTATESMQRIKIGYGGCAFRRAPALRKRLLELRNRSQLMSLEVWGDTRMYRARQKVLFYFRSPMPSYVTLFWIGPKGAVVVPVVNEKIPAHRNVQMNSGGIIVPPFGLERWVAISTLEPIPLTCRTGTRGVRATLDRMVALPHGVGRWQVRSGPASLLIRSGRAAPPTRE